MFENLVLKKVSHKLGARQAVGGDPALLIVDLSRTDLRAELRSVEQRRALLNQAKTYLTTLRGYGAVVFVIAEPGRGLLPQFWLSLDTAFPPHLLDELVA